MLIDSRCFFLSLVFLVDVAAFRDHWDCTEVLEPLLRRANSAAGIQHCDSIT